MSLPTITLNSLVDDASIVHLAVENRNINQLNKFELTLLEQQDTAGETPLHYAVTNNDIEICRLLLDRNQDLLYIKCKNGYTPYTMLLKPIPLGIGGSAMFSYLYTYCTCVNCMCGKRRCYICGQGEYPEGYTPCKLHKD